MPMRTLAHACSIVWATPGIASSVTRSCCLASPNEPGVWSGTPRADRNPANLTMSAVYGWLSSFPNSLAAWNFSRSAVVSTYG